jgi:hypothetical protein
MLFRDVGHVIMVAISGDYGHQVEQADDILGNCCIGAQKFSTDLFFVF